MILFFLILSVLSSKIQVTDLRKVRELGSTKPGIKVAVTQQAMQYVLKQSIPYFKKELQHLTFPDIHTSVGTPIGSITLDITSFQLTSFDLNTPSIKIIGGNLFQVDDSSVKATATANWHYREKSFPHISDSGHFDLNIDISLMIQSGAVIDTSKKSHIRVQNKALSIDFHKFDLKMHGGASWLYNLLIGAMKGDIEKAIRDTVEKEVPPILNQQAQEAIDKLELDIDVFEGVHFEFLPRDIVFSDSKQFLGIGVSGVFHKSGISPYSGEPASMPDISETPPEPMIGIFVSSWSCDSAGYVTDAADILTYTLTNKDIPPEWPIKLNTSFFEDVVPNLYKMFPNKEMQFTFKADPKHPPEANFINEGLEVKAFADIIFQVLNDTTTTSPPWSSANIVDAFTLELDLVMNGTVSIGTKDENTQYVIQGKVGYESMKITLKQTIIGDVDVKEIEDTVTFLLDKVVLPLVNQMLQDGVPLPDIPFFTLVNPKILYHGGYLEVRSDFTFVPPTEF